MRTPQQIFAMPERLVVPYFQRPYVWSVKEQWAPLWADIAAVAQRQLVGEAPAPHFLGAVVLQAAPQKVGHLPERSVIDGQQRLTTLQLLIDAVHAALVEGGHAMPAARLEALVTNGVAFRSVDDDQHKVWPTKRDRAAYFAVMAAEPPVDYAAHDLDSRLVQAHRYFHAEAVQWLTAETADEDSATRGSALADAISQRLAMVVIELAADENAQEIFETLNARGTPLTPADLIKNYVFQRLAAEGDDVELAYQRHWQEFEAPFWEAEVSAGRIKQQRASLFIAQWLVSQTGEEVLDRRVFDTFKRVAARGGDPMLTVLSKLSAAAAVYRRFVESAAARTEQPSRVDLFAYRTAVLESEAVRPLVIHLLDPALPPVPPDQLDKALDVVESWLVRRMLVRRTAASYSQVVAALIGHLLASDRDRSGDEAENYLRDQTAFNWYWPDDKEVRAVLTDVDIYRRLSRARLRMVLEALEDSLRGFVPGGRALGGQRVVRGQYAIEHVLPQAWETHWPLHEERDADSREALVHTLGNLTLLTTSLNSKVSNGPWAGASGKREALERHDVLMLNRDLLRAAPVAWTDADIEQRTNCLVERVLTTWPVPEDHEWADEDDVAPQRRVHLRDLVATGLLEPGTVVHAKPARARGAVATVTEDGGLRLGDQVFATPSGAAKSLSGRSENGWLYWLVDVEAGRSLADVQAEYLDLVADEPEDDADLDEDEDQDG